MYDRLVALDLAFFDIGPTDADSQYHGATFEVVDVHVNDLNTETDRLLDAYSYTLRDTSSGENLPLSFRHQDLVPVDEN